jgi:hypothetical protein
MFKDIATINYFGLESVSRNDKVPTVALIVRMLELQRKARREGILALYDDVDSIDNGDISQFLRMVIDGTDRNIINDFVFLKLTSAIQYSARRFSLFCVWVGITMISDGINEKLMYEYFREIFGLDADLLGSINICDCQISSVDGNENELSEGIAVTEGVFVKPFLTGFESVNRLSPGDSSLENLMINGPADRAVDALLAADSAWVWKLFSLIPLNLPYLAIVRELYSRVSLLAKETNDSQKARWLLLMALNQIPSDSYNDLLELSRNSDPELADRMDKDSFRFSDTVKLDDRDIQKVIREIPSDEIACALSYAGDELREKWFRNMTPDAARDLRDEIACMTPSQKRLAVRSQMSILRTIDILAGHGEIGIWE